MLFSLKIMIETYRSAPAPAEMTRSEFNILQASAADTNTLERVLSNYSQYAQAQEPSHPNREYPPAPDRNEIKRKVEPFLAIKHSTYLHKSPLKISDMIVDVIDCDDTRNLSPSWDCDDWPGHEYRTLRRAFCRRNPDPERSVFSDYEGLSMACGVSGSSICV